jgi:hypothetical protein
MARGAAVALSFTVENYGQLENLRYVNFPADAGGSGSRA